MRRTSQRLLPLLLASAAAATKASAAFVPPPTSSSSRGSSSRTHAPNASNANKRLLANLLPPPISAAAGTGDDVEGEDGYCIGPDDCVPDPDRYDLRPDVEMLLSRLSPSRMVDHSPAATDHPNPIPRVYLLGTGLSPLATDLPLSTLSILTRADVVLHDSLSLDPAEISKVVREGCVVRGVGKRGDDYGLGGLETQEGGGRNRSVRQDEIDGLLVRYASELVEDEDGNEATSKTVTDEVKDDNCNNDDDDDEPMAAAAAPAHQRRQYKYPTIVRLKGGDPFLFGRSRTEIESLKSHSIPYQVVPALSSAVAGPHLAGIPLTDPLLKADSFAVFSGTNAAGLGMGLDDGGRDWDGLDVATLVFLMIGRLDKLEGLCRRLAANEDGRQSVSRGGSGSEEVGDDEDNDRRRRRRRWTNKTDCAVVTGAGRPGQRVWRGVLGNIVDVIREDLGEDAVTVSPAIFVVGRTASLDLMSF